MMKLLAKIVLIILILQTFIKAGFYISPHIVELKSRIICGNETSIVVWHETTQNGNSYLKFSPIGSDKIILLAGDGTENALDPTGVSLSDSTFVIVWQGYNKNLGASINAALVRIDGQILQKFRIRDYDSVERYHPVIIDLNSRKYLVVWQDAKFGDYDIVGTVRTLGSLTRNSIFKINDDTTHFSQYYPVIGKIGSLFPVLWEDRQLGYSTLWGQFLNQAGEKIGTNFLLSPELTLDQTGLSVASYYECMAVVWQTAKPETMAIMLKYIIARKADTQTQTGDNKVLEPEISSLIQVSDSNLAFARADARCAFFHDGKLVVVWMDQRNSKMHIYAQLFDRKGNRIGRNFAIEKLFNIINQRVFKAQNEKPTGIPFNKDQFLPDVNIDQDGRLHVCWTEIDEDNVTLRLQTDTLVWRDWIPAEYHEWIKKRFWLHRPFPTPFSKSVNIKFELPSSEKVSIKIFDVAGRLIVELINDNFSAGIHSLSWDGKDMRGREVSAGSYFVLMEAADFTKTRRVVKIK